MTTNDATANDDAGSAKNSSTNDNGVENVPVVPALVHEAFISSYLSSRTNNNANIPDDARHSTTGATNNTTSNSNSGSNVDKNQNNGIVGATIIFTPEPSPPSSPRSLVARCSSVASSSNYIGTIAAANHLSSYSSCQNQNDAGTSAEEQRVVLEDYTSINSEYELLDGISSKGSMSIQVEDLEEEVEVYHDNGHEEKDKEISKSRDGIHEHRTANDQNDAFESPTFKCPNRNDMQAVMDMMDMESPGSSLPSLTSRHDNHPLSTKMATLPSTIDGTTPFQTPFKTPRDSPSALDGEDVYETPHGGCITTKSITEDGATIQPHTKDGVSPTSSAGGGASSFSNMTKSMLSRIRYNVMGETEAILLFNDSDDDDDNKETVVTPFKNLQEYWEKQSSFSHMTKSMLGRILNKEPLTDVTLDAKGGEDGGAKTQFRNVAKDSSKDESVPTSALFGEEPLCSTNTGSLGLMDQAKYSHDELDIDVSTTNHVSELASDKKSKLGKVIEIFRLHQLIRLVTSLCVGAVTIILSASVPFFIVASNFFSCTIHATKALIGRTLCRQVAVKEKNVNDQQEVGVGTEADKGNSADTFDNNIPDEAYDFTGLSKLLLNDLEDVETNDDTSPIGKSILRELEGESVKHAGAEKSKDDGTPSSPTSHDLQELDKKLEIKRDSFSVGRRPSKIVGIALANSSTKVFTIASTGILIGLLMMCSHMFPFGPKEDQSSIQLDDLRCVSTHASSFPSVPSWEINLMTFEDVMFDLESETEVKAEVNMFGLPFNATFTFQEDAILDSRDKSTPSSGLPPLAAMISIIIAFLCAVLSKSKPTQPSRKTPASSMDEEKDQKNIIKGIWSEEENNQLRVGYKKHGDNWKMVATFVPTRTVQQVRTHGNYWLSIGSPTKMKRTRKSPAPTFKSNATVTPLSSENTPKISNASSSKSGTKILFKTEQDQVLGMITRSAERKQRMMKQQ